jgi:hypothetical protein
LRRPPRRGWGAGCRSTSLSSLPGGSRLGSTSSATPAISGFLSRRHRHLPVFLALASSSLAISAGAVTGHMAFLATLETPSSPGSSPPSLAPLLSSFVAVGALPRHVALLTAVEAASSSRSLSLSSFVPVRTLPSHVPFLAALEAPLSFGRPGLGRRAPDGGPVDLCAVHSADGGSYLAVVSHLHKGETVAVPVDAVDVDDLSVLPELVLEVILCDFFGEAAHIDLRLLLGLVVSGRR